MLQKSAIFFFPNPPPHECSHPNVPCAGPLMSWRRSSGLFLLLLPLGSRARTVAWMGRRMHKGGTRICPGGHASVKVVVERDAKRERDIDLGRATNFILSLYLLPSTDSTVIPSTLYSALFHLHMSAPQVSGQTRSCFETQTQSVSCCV